MLLSTLFHGFAGTKLNSSCLCLASFHKAWKLISQKLSWKANCAAILALIIHIVHEVMRNEQIPNLYEILTHILPCLDR